MKALLLFPFLIFLFSCSYITQAKILAKFEYATGIWIDKDMSPKTGAKPCRITNVEILKKFRGSGYLITGKCDNEPHVFFKTDKGVKIDLTASCSSFKKFMQIKIENYRIKEVKTFKDEYVFQNGDLISSNVVNFYYLKTAIKILKERENE